MRKAPMIEDIRCRAPIPLKQAVTAAATASGKPVSVWIRETLAKSLAAASGPERAAGRMAIHDGAGALIAA